MVRKVNNSTAVSVTTIQRSCALAAFVCSCSLSTVAAEWDFQPSVFAGATYTNNVLLGSEGAQQDDLILEFSPSLLIVREGKRANLSLDYRLRGLFYTDDDARNEAFSYLQASINSTVVPDFFYLDTNASISQAVVDPRQNNGFSSISVSGNLSELITFDIAPRITRKLGAYTTFDASYQAGIVENDNPAIFDSKQDTIVASLNNTGGAGLIDWEIEYTDRRIEYDIGQEIELKRLGAEAGIRLGPRTEIVFEGGQDSNNVGQLTGTRIAEGDFWNVGLRGGIGNNTTYDVRVGEQFFGDSYSVSFNRQSLRTETEISYSEEATTIGAQQLGISNAQSLLPDISGLDLPGSDPSLYLRKRFGLTTSYSRAKSTWRGSVYYEDRNFIRTALDGAKENTMGAGLAWTWQYDNVTTVQSDLNYSRLDSRDGVTQPEDVRFGVNARRILLKTSYVSAGFYRSSRSAIEDFREFTEYSLVFGFGRQF